MTELRPNHETADVESRGTAPHPPPGTRGHDHHLSHSVRPERFRSLRERILPEFPLLNGGLRLRRNATARALRLERWLIAGLAVSAVIVYLAVNAGLPEELLTTLGLDPSHPYLWQVAQAGYWSALSLVAFAVWRVALTTAPRPSAPLVGVAALAGLFQVSLLIAAGLVLGFGRSPYSSDPPQVIANLLYVFAVLTAIELTRACVVVVLARTNPTLAVAIGTMAFAVMSLPLARLAAVHGGEATFAFVGGDLLPALAVGLVASVLALAGGPIPAITYGAMLLGFEWLSPILPHLDWAATAFVGTLGPVVALIVLHQPSRGRIMTGGSAQHSLGLAPGIAAVLAIWVIGGLLGVQPVAVSGPSMSPTLLVGDLVIIHEVPTDSIAVGDVIRYSQGPVDVVHRVIDVYEEGGRLFFVTQGDNNNAADEPILASRQDGKVTVKLPKLGWPSIWLRKVLS